MDRQTDRQTGLIRSEVERSGERPNGGRRAGGKGDERNPSALKAKECD
jgi:hypothetical protein